VPRVRAKGQRVKADTIYTATTSFAADDLAGVIQQGARLRGDHAAVQSHPEWFVEDGTPEDEWPSPIPDPPAPVQPDHDLRVSALPIPLGPIVELVRDVKLLVGGGAEAWTGGQVPGEVVTVRAGTRFSASEPIVARLPDAFRAV
jgi:hypothetical protein